MTDLRHLRYFVAVAEELHFGNAARRLHMSQPPLSKRIAELEADLGVRLLDRDNRHVELTAAGKVLLDRARLILGAVASARRAVQLATQDGTSIRVALPPETSGSVVLEILGGSEDFHGKVNLIEASTSEQQRLFAEGELDIGVLRHPYDEDGLISSRPLFQELGVILSENHHLASRDEINLPDLSGSPLVAFPRAMAPGLYDDILEKSRNAGYSPIYILHNLRQASTLLIALNGVAFRPKSALEPAGMFSTSAALKWKPIAGSKLYWRTSVVTRNNDIPGIRSICRVIETALQKHDDWLASSK